MVIDYRMTHVAIQEKLSSTVNAYTWEIFAAATSKLSKRKAVSSGGKVIQRDGSWRKCNETVPLFSSGHDMCRVKTT